MINVLGSLVGVAAALVAVVGRATRAVVGGGNPSKIGMINAALVAVDGRARAVVGRAT